MQAPAPIGNTPIRIWSPRRVILATLTVVGVAAIFLFLNRFSEVLFIVFVAAVLATALRPAVLWLKRRGVPEGIGIVLMYLILFLVVAGVIGTLVPLLANQGSELVKSARSYYPELRNNLVQSGSLLLRNLGANLPPSLELPAGGATTPSGDNAAILNQATSALGSAFWLLFGTLSAFLIAFFWILNHDQIVKAVSLLLPQPARDQAAVLWDEAEQKVGGYVRGTAILCISIGVLSAIAFFLIGLPSALLIAVLAGILEAIPYVGPLLTALVAVVVCLAEAPDKIWYVLAACAVIQQIENAVLVPRVMGRAVGVNALVTLLAIAAFGTLLGLLGAILAIPLAAIIQVLLDHLVLQAEGPAPVIVGRDKVAALRYQTQDLAQDLRDRITAVDENQTDELYEERIEVLVGDLDAILAQMSIPAAPEAATVGSGT